MIEPNATIRERLRMGFELDSLWAESMGMPTGDTKEGLPPNHAGSSLTCSKKPCARQGRPGDECQLYVLPLSSACDRPPANHGSCSCHFSGAPSSDPGLTFTRQPAAKPD
jgi:hypothetical protein